MAAQKKNISFGLYLKDARLKKGISLENISREIKIGADVLRFIENEDYTGLPPEVFAKGFLRAYAKALGVNADSVVAGYLAGRKAFNKTTKAELELNRSEADCWPRLAAALGGFCGVILLSAIFLSPFWDTRFSPPSNSVKQAAGERYAHRAPETGQNPLPVETPAKLSLRALAVENTWIKIIVDSRDPEEYALVKGQKLQFIADSGFNILIGNADAVKLFLNDKPVAIKGKQDQALNIQLPCD